MLATGTRSTGGSDFRTRPATSSRSMGTSLFTQVAKQQKTLTTTVAAHGRCARSSGKASASCRCSFAKALVLQFTSSVKQTEEWAGRIRRSEACDTRLRYPDHEPGIGILTMAYRPTFATVALSPSCKGDPIPTAFQLSSGSCASFDTPPPPPRRARDPDHHHASRIRSR